MTDLKTYLVQTFHLEESFAEVVARQIMERFDKGGCNMTRKDEVAKLIFKRIYGNDCEWGKTGTMDDSSWRRAEEQCLGDADQIDAHYTVRLKECLGVLSELADLMDAVRTGDYKPDSFTTQSARILLKKFQQEKPCPECKGERIVAIGEHGRKLVGCDLMICPTCNGIGKVKED